MNARELIDLLSQLPPDCVVYVDRGEYLDLGAPQVDKYEKDGPATHVFAVITSVEGWGEENA